MRAASGLGDSKLASAFGKQCGHSNAPSASRTMIAWHRGQATANGMAAHHSGRTRRVYNNSRSFYCPTSLCTTHHGLAEAHNAAPPSSPQLLRMAAYFPVAAAIRRSSSS
jgi:hypothetical protein